MSVRVERLQGEPRWSLVFFHHSRKGGRDWEKPGHTGVENTVAWAYVTRARCRRMHEKPTYEGFGAAGGPPGGVWRKACGEKARNTPEFRGSPKVKPNGAPPSNSGAEWFQADDRKLSADRWRLRPGTKEPDQYIGRFDGRHKKDPDNEAGLAVGIHRRGVRVGGATNSRRSPRARGDA